DLNVLDISDFPPLAEFVPLIRRMNPIFSLAPQMYYTCPMVEGTLELLKKIENPPVDLVNMFKEYQFMQFVSASIYDMSFGSPKDDIDSDCSPSDPEDRFPVLSVAELEQCLLLCRIVQAYILEYKWDLVDLHVLLDISWDELRAAICTLRPFTGADKGKIIARLQCMARRLLSDASSRAISLELARGSIQLLNDIRTGQQPSKLWYEVFTQIKATTPPLGPSNEFGFPVEDACRPNHYHNVLQWLKAFPNPPQDVIAIWQDHLMAAGDDWKWHWVGNDPDYWWKKWQNELKEKGLFLPNQP
ncbi:hypothetical protein B0H13DRAFT_2498528, partial [Mycena leptocephala]